MATLEVTQAQLRVIQSALDFYTRVGLGQMRVIADHPTFEAVLYDALSPKKPLEVGDKTQRGEVVEIGDGYVKTRGSWGNGEEVRTWTDVDMVRHSIDYGVYHSVRDRATELFVEGRNLLTQTDRHVNSSYGINHPSVDESCRVAFDVMQAIRHEFWKRNPDRMSMSVASSISVHSKDGHKIKCKINEND